MYMVGEMSGWQQDGATRLQKVDRIKQNVIMNRAAGELEYMGLFSAHVGL